MTSILYGTSQHSKYTRYGRFVKRNVQSLALDISNQKAPGLDASWCFGFSSLRTVGEGLARNSVFLRLFRRYRQFRRLLEESARRHRTWEGFLRGRHRFASAKRPR